MDFLSQVEARKKSLKATRTLLTSETGERYEIFEGVSRKLNEKRVPFVVDDKPDMQIARIMSGLYLSSQDPVMYEDSLKAHRIRHLLSLGVRIAVKYEWIDYYYVDILDLPEFEIATVLEECFRIIDDCRKENILVHCNAGVSRSATVVIAYLMSIEELSYDEAYEKVKCQRKCVKPNDGFVRQLREFAILKNTRARHFSRDPDGNED